MDHSHSSKSVRPVQLRPRTHRTPQSPDTFDGIVLTIGRRRAVPAECLFEIARNPLTIFVTLAQASLRECIAPRCHEHRPALRHSVWHAEPAATLVLAISLAVAQR